MNTDKHGLALKHGQLTDRILRCAFEVANQLGAGFLEKVYENALALELKQEGLGVVQQAALDVTYKGTVVGQYTADLVVENRVIVELKATKGLDSVHEAQCLNYLRACRLEVCLLINFGTPRIQIKRLVL